MKKKAPLILLFLALLQSPISAGEFFVGVRTWQASWSPGVLRKIENDAAVRTLRSIVLKGKTVLVTVPFAADDISGFYSGPVISYQTDDRKWSYNLVLMQGQSGRVGFTEGNLSDNTLATSYGTNSINANPIRLDSDFTIAYALTDRSKIFIGFKRQQYIIDIAERSQGSLAFTVDNGLPSKFTARTPIFGGGKLFVEHIYYGPAMGIAYSFPLSPGSALSMSLGYFSAKGRTRETSQEFESNLRSDDSLFETFEFGAIESSLRYRGITYELTYTGAINRNWFIQLGYRGQYSVVQVDFSKNNVFLSLDRDKDGAVTTLEYEDLPGDKFLDRFGGFSVSILTRI